MEDATGERAAGPGGAGPDRPFGVAFLVVPGFSMLALSSAVEPLRSANRRMGVRRYDWRVVACAPGPVPSGNGLELTAALGVREAPSADLTIAVASLDVEDYREAAVFDWFRRLQGAGRLIGAISNGTLVLARAGVLGARRVTVHWEMERRLAEEFPDLTVCPDLYCWDRGVLTAAGGTAALDMMLALIAERDGREVAADVAEQFLHGPPRDSTARQRQDVAWRYRVTDRRLISTLRLMEERLSDPLRIGRIAEAVGISERQLERLFVARFGQSPSDFYMALRLKAARGWLLTGSESLERIAERAGFSSTGHFSRSFKAWAGVSPSTLRRRGTDVGRVQELGAER